MRRTQRVKHARSRAEARGHVRVPRRNSWITGEKMASCSLLRDHVASWNILLERGILISFYSRLRFESASSSRTRILCLMNDVIYVVYGATIKSNEFSKC